MNCNLKESSNKVNENFCFLPASTRDWQGAESPEYTIFQSETDSRTIPQESLQCLTGTVES